LILKDEEEYSDIASNEDDDDENESETGENSPENVEREDLVIEDSDAPESDNVEEGVEVAGETDSDSIGGGREDELVRGLQIEISSPTEIVESDLQVMVIFLNFAAVLYLS